MENFPFPGQFFGGIQFFAQPPDHVGVAGEMDSVRFAIRIGEPRPSIEISM